MAGPHQRRLDLRQSRRARREMPEHLQDSDRRHRGDRRRRSPGRRGGLPLLPKREIGGRCWRGDCSRQPGAWR
jgi:hypothetical protein